MEGRLLFRSSQLPQLRIALASSLQETRGIYSSSSSSLGFLSSLILHPIYYLCSLGCVFHVEYKHLITPLPFKLSVRDLNLCCIITLFVVVCLDGCKEEKGSSCRRSYKTKQIQQSRSFNASHQGHSFFFYGARQRGSKEGLQLWAG